MTQAGFPIGAAGLISSHALLLSRKRCCGPLEGGRRPQARRSQPRLLLFPPFVLDWLCPCQGPSAAPVAGSVPRSSGRCTSQPGGKTRQTCASFSALAGRPIIHWVTDALFSGEVAAGPAPRPAPPPCARVGRAAQRLSLHSQRSQHF